MANIIVRLCFLFSLIFSIGQMTEMKKKNCKMELTKWIIISSYILFYTLAASCVILNELKISINLISLTCVNLLVGACLAVYNKKRGTQDYYFDKAQLIMPAIIVGVCAALWFFQFSGGWWLNYSTSDPGVHLKNAMDIVNDGEIQGWYYGAFSNSVVIQIFKPLIETINLYKIFVSAEFLTLSASAIIFYIAISEIVQNRKLIIFSTVLYTIGYPLNNMVYGFGYLGKAVTVCLLILVLVIEWSNSIIKNGQFYIAVALSLFTLNVCYPLFSPAAYAFVFIAIAYILRVRKSKWHSILGNEIMVFALPTFVGVTYVLYGSISGLIGILLNNTGTRTQMGVLTSEGSIFKDLYTGCLFFLPLILLVFYYSIKARENFSLLVFFVTTCCYTLALLLLVLMGTVSTYYYYKLYYLLWALLLLLSIKGLEYIGTQSRPVEISLIVAYCLMFVFGLSGIEGKLIASNPGLASDTGAVAQNGVYYNVFLFNYEQITTRKTISDSRRELYEIGLSIYRDKNNSKKIILLDNFNQIYWFEAITNQRIEEYYPWHLLEDKPVRLDEMDLKELVKKYQKNNEYIIIANDDDDRSVLEEALRKLEDYQVVYENKTGAIIKISK